MKPRIDGRLHLSLIVRDAANSAAWYRRVFGFEVARESGMQTTMPDADGAETNFTFTSLFHLPTRVLGLAEPVDALGAFRSDLVELKHFSSHVETRPELEEWMRHLEDLGVANSEVLREGAGLAVRFRDPDRIPQCQQRQQ